MRVAFIIISIFFIDVVVGHAGIAKKELSLSINCTKESFELGEPIEINFRMANQSKTSLTILNPTIFPFPSEAWGPSRVFGIYFLIKTPDNKWIKIVRQDLYQAPVIPNQSHYLTLSPNSDIQGKVLLLDDEMLGPYRPEQKFFYCTDDFTVKNGYAVMGECGLSHFVLAKPGTYIVTAFYTNKPIMESLPTWSGEVKSNSVKFNIKAEVLRKE